MKKLTVNKFFKKYKKLVDIELIKLSILDRENKHNRQCSELWIFTNDEDESFVLGQFEEIIWNLGEINSITDEFKPNYLKNGGSNNER